MSIEKPDFPSVEPSKAEREHEQQTKDENVARERFITDIVADLPDLTPEQREAVSTHVRTQAGAWRHYNGTDFTVLDASVNGNALNVVFGVYAEDQLIQEIPVEIPLF